MHEALPESEGLRERKRRQTLQRIAEVGLQYFVAKGYDATTLDEIAAAAGISRRTFFYYFKSKDDILVAYVGGYADALEALILEGSSAGAPLDIARDALVKLVSRFNEGLSKLWPGTRHRDRLRLVAMISIGVLRLSIDRWTEQNCKHPLAKYVRDAFRKLKTEI
jgi:AcrR family transcriptional regulator